MKKTPEQSCEQYPLIQQNLVKLNVENVYPQKAGTFHAGGFCKCDDGLDATPFSRSRTVQKIRTGYRVVVWSSFQHLPDPHSSNGNFAGID
ncbi:hypothetical protein P4126_33745 [Pseudomonas aeruginosa]|nr:hypothetical protein [Pseudomonas aeruginosa]